MLRSSLVRLRFSSLIARNTYIEQWGLTLDSRINISQVLTPSPPECYNTEAILFKRCLHSEIHYIYILYFTAISDNLGKVEAYSGAVFVSNRVGSFMKASEEKDRNTFLV